MYTTLTLAIISSLCTTTISDSGYCKTGVIDFSESQPSLSDDVVDYLFFNNEIPMDGYSASFNQDSLDRLLTAESTLGLITPEVATKIRDQSSGLIDLDTSGIDGFYLDDDQNLDRPFWPGYDIEDPNTGEPTPPILGGGGDGGISTLSLDLGEGITSLPEIIKPYEEYTKIAALINPEERVVFSGNETILRVTDITEPAPSIDFDVWFEETMPAGNSSNLRNYLRSKIPPKITDLELNSLGQGGVSFNTGHHGSDEWGMWFLGVEISPRTCAETYNSLIAGLEWVLSVNLDIDNTFASLIGTIYEILSFLVLLGNIGLEVLVSKLFSFAGSIVGRVTTLAYGLGQSFWMMFSSNVISFVLGVVLALFALGALVTYMMMVSCGQRKMGLAAGVQMALFVPCGFVFEPITSAEYHLST